MKKSLTRKVMLMMACGMLTAYSASAQGWVGDFSGQRLYAVNDSLKLNTIFVGIGTNAPNAQLHTTGTVRFTGITQNNTLSRLLVQDTTGRLSWRDVATLGGGSGAAAWLLHGNAGINPDSDFLGTLDTNRLAFRTANIQRAVILGNGNVGIGLPRPVKPLQVHSAQEDNNVFLSGPSPSAYFSLSATQATSAPYSSPLARIGLATRSGAFTISAHAGDFVLHTITNNGSMLFSVGVDSTGMNGVERARINSAGNFGINTVAPTAKLHVKGNVRFENLPSGTGSFLVIDANGNVFRSSAPPADTLPGDTLGAMATTRTANDVAALRQQVNELTQALADVQAQLAAIKSGSIQIATNSTTPFLLANAPNPFNGSTTIKYAYPRSASRAYLTVSDLNGKPIKRFNLAASNNSSVTINLDAAVTSGTYIYSLEVDGRVVESKKMVYTK